MLYLKPRILWVSQVAFLALMTIWVAWDPACELMIERLGRGFTTPVAAYRDAVAYVGWFRPAMLMAVIAGMLLSLSWLLREMLGRRQGNKQLRSLLAMLALTAIVAAWCGLAINHSAFAWHAKRARLAWQVDQFESIAGPLRNDWPDQDGELPLIGPFMAYPFGKPSTLLLLKAPSVPGGDGSICAIERGESGSIKLQLGGLHGDDWVEWHPAASKPRSFTGGLGDSHDLGSSAALGAGWYLVRYKAPNRIGESRYTTRVSAIGKTEIIPASKQADGYAGWPRLQNAPGRSSPAGRSAGPNWGSVGSDAAFVTRDRAWGQLSLQFAPFVLCSEWNARLRSAAGIGDASF